MRRYGNKESEKKERLRRDRGLSIKGRKNLGEKVLERDKVTYTHVTSDQWGPAQRIVAEMVYFAQHDRDTGGTSYTEEVVEDGLLHAFLALKGERAIGVLLVDKGANAARFTWKRLRRYENGEALDPAAKFRDDPDRYTGSLLWIALGERRHGVAMTLHEAAAKALGIALDDLGVTIPFSEGGRALARKLHPERIYVEFGGSTFHAEDEEDEDENED